MSRLNRGRGGRGRGAFGGFSAESDHPSNSVHPSMLKQARRSGVLNLSQRGLESVPDAVWTVQEDVPEEAKSISLDNTDDKWWETVDLTKLILASNRLSSIGEGLRNLGALTVLDVHDNQLTSLPKAISALENLQKLDISHNRLSDIPLHVGLLQNLVTLQADHNQLTSLCEEVCSLKQLEKLDVSNNQIDSVPRYICLLCRLRFFNVSNNKLTHLPPDIGSLNALVLFDATHNQLMNLPEEFGHLPNLEQLHLRHNKLEYLPVLRHCTKLKELLVGNNNIRGLSPEHLQHLSSVTILEVRDNKLEKLPDEITLMERLERLDLTNNDISTLPYVLGTMVPLKSVVLDGNPLRSVRRDIVMRGTQELKKYLASRLSDEERDKQTADQVSSTNVALPGAQDQPLRAHDLHQMKSLDYSNKKIKSLPDDVVEAALEAGVKVINLSKNLLEEVPSQLSVLSPNLTELNLSSNKIAKLGPSVAQFSRLLLLDLRTNQLSDLPMELSRLSSLRELALSYNRFKSIPESVYSLKSLEILFINDNQVNSLDVSKLSTLSCLATLDLQNNDLTQVPPELGNCTGLKSLSLSGNALRMPRPAVLAKGTLAVLEYLRSRIVT
ncbi:leucine-rich repeat-containing protein 40 [Aplysia californica]|uniref:Leucine-rich repeat-containing protein 40 n=1 Tax=Aplysia californica TaxID=6500 RepID=A0ABM0JZF9_APLCA|nr:leucine-rich repeat-containing protein 40 [Aplysia californica]XP_005105167.1 leucine-rich repeat-containing protein 40 [Aplysia californica]XP_005105168.1 leucine-rich repeat-containing protein 40 [Aplysia californica]XP_005105169.1 leucine-rich repeat-containing protein 40 [Aplysia californica]